MRFEKEALFREMVSKTGMNLYLGAGFSVYAYNGEDEVLPLGKQINEQLKKQIKDICPILIRGSLEE